jgi:hypothetical protein
VKSAISIVERAFELARSGYFKNATDVNKQLKKEGYIQGLVDEHLRGQDIKQKIKSLCREAILDRDAATAANPHPQKTPLGSEVKQKAKKP